MNYYLSPLSHVMYGLTSLPSGSVKDSGEEISPHLLLLYPLCFIFFRFRLGVMCFHLRSVLVMCWKSKCKEQSLVAEVGQGKIRLDVEVYELIIRVEQNRIN